VRDIRNSGKDRTVSRIEKYEIIRMKLRVPTFSILIQHNFGNTSQSNKTGRRNKRNSNRKRSQIIPICK
jgi:hypothetical protein